MNDDATRLISACSVRYRPRKSSAHPVKSPSTVSDAAEATNPPSCHAHSPGGSTDTTGMIRSRHRASLTMARVASVGSQRITSSRSLHETIRSGQDRPPSARMPATRASDRRSRSASIHPRHCDGGWHCNDGRDADDAEPTPSADSHETSSSSDSRGHIASACPVVMPRRTPCADARSQHARMRMAPTCSVFLGTASADPAPRASSTITVGQGMRPPNDDPASCESARCRSPSSRSMSQWGKWTAMNRGTGDAPAAAESASEWE